MKNYIKQKLREHYNISNYDFGNYDFGDVDYSQLKSDKPKINKQNNFKLLINDLKAKHTVNKNNSYSFTLGPTTIFFKPTFKPNVIELDLLKTDDSMGGKGYAKTILQRFLSSTDKHGFKVILSVVPRDKKTNNDGLVKLYSSFGFKFISGSDFEMIR